LSHSDLLCCLFSKEKVLIECRRIIREQGKMVFSVIYITPGLDKIDYERAVLNSPNFIQTDGEYETMLRDCGWHIDDQIDLSKEYQETCRLQIEADDLHQQELIKLLGASLKAVNVMHQQGLSTQFLFPSYTSAIH
jgi:hypothetical protein